MKNRFMQRVLAGGLSLLTALQPALATTYQYNVYIKGFQGAGTAMGSGLGAVDPGADPTAPKPPVKPAPQLALSADHLTFNLLQGEGPETQTTVLSNRGTADAAIGGLMVSNQDFQVGSDCPDTLVPGATCKISVTFEQTGQDVVSYVMPLDVQGQVNPVSLTLTSQVPTSPTPRPKLVAKADAVNMGDLNPGQQGSGQSTLVNVGQLAADLGGIMSANGFNITSDCPARLEPQAACTISASFSTYAPGDASTTLSLTGQAGGTPIPLTFYAHVLANPSTAPVLGFDTALVNFGAVPVGTTAVKTVKLSNSGPTAATLSAVPHSSDFDISADCGTTLAAGSSCSFSVMYTAKAGSTSPAFQLKMSAIEGGSAQTLIQGALATSTPTTPAPSLVFSPDSVAFDTTSLGSNSQQNVTLTNQGKAVANLKGLSLEYDTYGSFSQKNNCSDTLAPGASCTINTTFTPNQALTVSARLKVLMADGSTAALGLSGLGQAAILGVSPDHIKFGAITLPGTTSAQGVSVTNTGNVTMTGLQLTSADSHAVINGGTCRTTLESHQSCAFSVAYAPTALGDIQSSVSIATDNAGSAKVSLTGSVVQVAASPSPLNFPDTGVGQSATTQNVTLSNNGASPLVFDGISVSQGITDFAESNNCGTSLQSGASCTITVGYTPTLEGERTGVLSVVAYGTVVAQVPLTGQASATTLELSTLDLRFPDTNVGTSQMMALVVKNPTSQTVDITGMGVASGTDIFAQANNCTGQLAPGASCAVNIQATPSALAAFTGTWGLTSSVGDKTVNLSVTGTVSKPDLTGGSNPPPPGPATGDGYAHYTIKFLDTEFGTSSAVRNVTFSNSGTGPLKVLGISLVAGASDFGESNNCGSVIAAGKSCTLALLFTPSMAGPRTGGVALDSDNGKFYFDLSGTGAAPAGAWKGVSDYGMVPVGQTVQHTFTLQNSGSASAKNVAATLSGKDVAIVTNGCGDATNPITLNIGETCNVSVSYSPSVTGQPLAASLQASGNWVGKTVSVSLTGMAPVPGFAIDATPTGDFGTVSVGATSTRTYTVRNTGKIADAIASLPPVSGDGYSRLSTTCTAGLSLPANGTCSVVVADKPTAAGTQGGMLSVASTHGAGASLALTGNAIQATYALSGAVASNTTPNANMGSMSVNSSKVNTADYYLRDNTNTATVVASNVTLTGNPGFSITTLNVLNSSGSFVANCSTGPTASTGVCDSGAPGRVIHVQVAFTKAQSGNNTATLHFDHNGVGGSVELALTGSGVYDSAANVYSVTYGSYGIPSFNAASGSMGSVSYGSVDGSQGAPVSKIFTIKNDGHYGTLGATPTLTGDADFTITSFVATNLQGNSRACTVAADGRSASQCMADDVSGGTLPYLQVTVQFKPTAKGTRQGTLTLNHTGVNTPNPIVMSLTGTGAYDANAGVYYLNNSMISPSWDATNGSIGSVSYGSPDSSQGSPITKVFTVKNSGNYGKLGVTGAIAGDADFTITRVSKVDVRGSIYANCALSADGKSFAQCLGDDPSVGGGGHIQIAVKFQPTAQGNRQATLTLNHTGVNTPNPIVMTLTGTGAYNVTAGVYYMDTSMMSPSFNATNGAFGSTATNSTVSKVFTVKNSGTYGKLGVTPSITGGTDFTITRIVKVDNRGNTYATVPIAADGLSTPQAISDDANTGPATHIQITVAFKPSAAGAKQATLTLQHSGVNTPNPITMTLSGTGT